MLNFTEFFIAYRYLHSKHKSNFISVTTGFSLLGIILGVAALIVVMAVMNGYREELTKITLGMSGHITIKGGRDGIIGYPDYLKALNKIEGVKQVTPQVDRKVMLSNKSAIAGGVLKGIEADLLKRKPMISSNLIEGNLVRFKEEEDSVILGVSLANSLGVSVGDEIKVVTATTNATVMGMVPRFKTFIVSGIFESGLYLYDNAYLYIPLKTAQKLFRLPENAITEIEFEVQNPYKTQNIKNGINKVLHGRYLIEDWQQQNAQILSALEIERAVMFLILTLIIIVAAFNIISSLYMLVNDKKSDIAILRTYGATRIMIIRIFMYIGAFIGIFGTLMGVFLGVSFAENIETIRRFLESMTGTTLFDPVVYYLSQLPAKLDFEDVYKISGLTTVLSIIATLFPAIKAASINPVQGLKND
ncbi:lipoprotein-releasing ABC transporter permease subunit [Rickettsiales endosymbiont of Stachyamoeba lipophora]|uniref:lipoprotein-releasing ABC transporter permease subunit n=1 Tax=Rickettsiales endosymbiont of Stachyamoeba lipophora TaxID=2486578 RepID=UPI000F64FCE0|nr:lipoprotein-releasing ABC transporter permease subunit [Rickettsiales endosymbiont of Stachyamoeba lipophora]AZL15404.1 lipoprotein-releasing ABC transporter permease subunit [Rickettsiales endosymbiont of Stachyamoeba lipophora]